MSFSSEIKTDLSKYNTTNPCCILAELSALCLHGNIDTSNNIYFISFFHPSIAKKFVKLFSGFFDIHPKVKIIKERTFGRLHRYELTLNNLWQQLNEIGILDDSLNILFRPPSRITNKRCCKSSYLRGVFMAKGYILDPQKGYHLEIIINDGETMDFICGLMKQLQIKIGRERHNNKNRLYLKDAEEIIKLLSVIGSHSATLRLENLRIIKEIKGHANRLANCDSANANKIAMASIKQLQDIMVLDNSAGIHKLSESLNALCRARLKNPHMSIKELGETMNPPLSKSAVYHRFRRIAKLAEQALN